MDRVFLITLLLAGCASVQVTPLNPPPRAMTPRAANEVKLYLTKAPDAPYDEIYMIRSDAPNSKQALEAMREKGGELGCDAVIIAGAADRIVSSPDASGSATLSMREGFVGSCVVFR